VLADVYRCLGQEFDEASVGSLGREVPSLDLDTVERAVADAWQAGTPEPLGDALAERARSLVAEHRVDGGATE
jgi:hypothetical protein